MAWIVAIPPSPRHPRERYQVRFQDGKRQRSAGIYSTKQRALAEKRAVERGGRDELPRPAEPDPEKARTPFGEYVTSKWWPAWKGQHPSSAYGTRKKVEKRILPTFGDVPLGDLDASTIGAWKAAMVAEGLAPRSVNTYLSLLGTILNAAVDDDYLGRSPLLRRSGAGRAAATRNQPVRRREVWLSREQLVRIARAISDPYGSGRGVEKAPKTEAGIRTIALDAETVDALRAHRQLVGGGSFERIFTSPGGSRGPGGTLAGNTFARVWKRALRDAELGHAWPEFGGLHFHDLRHTHATWLIARRVPMIAVAGRLGHANAVVTMMVYAHVDKLVDRGLLTTGELGLAAPASRALPRRAG